MNNINRSAYGVTIIRVVVGIVFLVHGLQKLTMMGVDGTAGFLTSLGVPAAGLMAVLLIAVELLGGLALILGLFTRYVSIALLVDMLVAILTVHLANGFYASDGGYEFPLVLLAASAGLVLLGSGPLALDDLLPRRAGARPAVSRAA